MSKNNKVHILLKSDILSGAEKRFLKISSALTQKNQNIVLILNEKLYEVSLKDEVYCKYIKELENERRIIVIKWGLLKKILFKIAKYFTGKPVSYAIFEHMVKKENINKIHSVLSLSLSALYKKYHPNITHIYEVTSPDKAEQLKKGNKNCTYVDKIDVLHAVSDNVELILNQMFNESTNDKLIKKPPLTFFNPIKKFEDIDEVLSQKEKTVVFAHRLIPRKNGVVYAKAIRKLSYIYPDWTFYLFGNGEEEEIIRNILPDTQSNIVQTYTSNIEPYLRRSSIFVSIIEPDNHPSQSVLEAMYNCNALLLSDRGFTKERFYDNNGLIIDDINEDTVFEALSNLIVSDDLQSYQLNSRKLVESDFDYNRYLDYYIENIINSTCSNA